MSTRGAIAFGAVASWVGVYQHWDSYPSSLGPKVWAFLQEHGIEALQRFIEAHPGGFSSFPDSCYCHDEYFAQRDGSSAKDSPYFNEKAPVGLETNENTDALFIEWVYVIDRKSVV